jgi:hypothetical protein
MSKKIATVTIGGIRKRVRPCTRWGDEVEEGLNVMGIRNRQVLIRGIRQWRKKLLETMRTASLEMMMVMMMKNKNNNRNKSYHICIYQQLGKGKGKAIPLQSLTGPEVYRRLRFPDFKTIGT